MPPVALSIREFPPPGSDRFLTKDDLLDENVDYFPENIILSKPDLVSFAIAKLTQSGTPKVESPLCYKLPINFVRK